MTEPLTPYWASPVATLYLGSAASVLAQLPAESVDMAVTSPPFWGLRNYHVDGQIGLEKTPEEWLEHILAVFRAVRRVLRPWGTLWCEIGDSYAAQRWTGAGRGQPMNKFRDGHRDINPQKESGLPPGNLVGIPFRLTLALQADGWWLRSVIIWDKPAPMPESIKGWRWIKCRVKVRAQKAGVSPARIGVGMATGTKPQRDAPGGEWQGDALWADCPGCPKCAPNGGLVLRKGSWRPTESHSYILMLAKSASYFCNGEAVRESQTEGSLDRWDNGANGRLRYNSAAYEKARESFEDFGRYCPTGVTPDRKRNLRSVWSDISPEPSSMAHFAVFPTGLPEKCILAGTSEWGNCPRCGMPWAPVIDRGALVPDAPGYKPRGVNRPEVGVKTALTPAGATQGHPNFHYDSSIIGWRPACACGLTERVPAVVLDPFTGTSSTGVAAQRLGRKFIGIDLSEPYLKLSIKRLEGVPLPLEAR